MPLTLDDIARLSDVSRSTVSRVINADTNVKEETPLRRAISSRVSGICVFGSALRAYYLIIELRI